MKMTNRGNRLIYRLWAPIYDATVNHLFVPGRKRALDLLELLPGETVLLVGVGTGADLPLLPAGVMAVGIDLSAEMLSKAKNKVGHCAADVQLVQGDAQGPLVEDRRFDAVILNLILSVIPDGTSCLRTARRALRPAGRMVIFDKFLPEGRRPSLVRRFLNLFSTLLGTDINRSLSEIVNGLDLEVIHDEPSIGGGTYRVILLRTLSQ